MNSKDAMLWLKVLGECSALGAGMLTGRTRKSPDGAAQGCPDEPGAGVVAVLGGAGYIGSILVRKLLGKGRRVRILDNLMYGNEALRGIIGHPNLELMVGDCRSMRDVAAALRSAESVIHLASIGGDLACEHAPKTALEINCAATRMLIEIAKGSGVKRFVFASSCSVYGASDRLMGEDSNTRPDSLYAETNLECENMLLNARSESFHPAILRIATVFGDSYRRRFDLDVNLLTARAHAEGAIRIYNRDHWQPFVHVQDVAEGILSVMRAAQSLISGQIFNLGDACLNVTLADVAEEIRRVFPRLRIENVSTAGRRNYGVSFDKIRKCLNFRSSVGLHEGIVEVRRALVSGSVGDYRDIRYNNYEFLRKFGIPDYKNAVDARIMAVFLDGRAQFAGNAAVALP